MGYEFGKGLAAFLSLGRGGGWFLRLQSDIEGDCSHLKAQLGCVSMMAYLHDWQWMLTAAGSLLTRGLSSITFSGEADSLCGGHLRQSKCPKRKKQSACPFLIWLKRSHRDISAILYGSKQSPVHPIQGRGWDSSSWCEDVKECWGQVLKVPQALDKNVLVFRSIFKINVLIIYTI